MNHDLLHWITIVCSLMAIACMISVGIDLRRTHRIMRETNEMRSQQLNEVLENVKEIDRRRAELFEQRYELLCELARKGIDVS